MNTQVLIEPRNIPYDELEGLGLERVMVDDLPQPAMDNLLMSRPSPLLSLSIRNRDGEEKQFHGRVMLLKFDDATVHAVVIPKMKKATGLEEFDDYEREYLLSGNVLKAYGPTGNYYAQFDKVTNQVWKTETDAVDYNLSVLTSNSSNEKYFNTKNTSELQEGRPITIVNDNGEGKVTVGIDLLTPTGIRFSAGDVEAFNNDKTTDDIMRYSFGNYGCWTLTDDDSLEYTKEEDYTPEMRNIQNQYLKARKASEDDRKQQNLS